MQRVDYMRGKPSFVLALWQISRAITSRRGLEVQLWLLLILAVFVSGYRFTHDAEIAAAQRARIGAMAAIVERSELAVVTVSANTGRIIAWNHGATELLGYSAEEASQMDPLAFFPGGNVPESVANLLHSEDTRRAIAIAPQVVTSSLLTKSGEKVRVSIKIWGTELDGDFQYVCLIERQFETATAPEPAPELESPRATLGAPTKTYSVPTITLPAPMSAASSRKPATPAKREDLRVEEIRKLLNSYDSKSQN